MGPFRHGCLVAGYSTLGEEATYIISKPWNVFYTLGKAFFGVYYWLEKCRGCAEGYIYFFFGGGGVRLLSAMWAHE